MTVHIHHHHRHDKIYSCPPSTISLRSSSSWTYSIHLTLLSPAPASGSILSQQNTGFIKSIIAGAEKFRSHCSFCIFLIKAMGEAGAGRGVIDQLNYKSSLHSSELHRLSLILLFFFFSVSQLQENSCQSICQQKTTLTS